MNFIAALFGPPIPSEHKAEVNNLTNELLKIGANEDFLSERPGGAFNAQCRHIRTREIGRRLDQIGGFQLMENIYKKVRKKLGIELGAHLEFAWAEIGDWLT